MQATRTRYIILAGICLAAILAYLTRNAIAAAESTVRADLNLTKKESGFFISLFFWSYALCQIPSAAVAQRIGMRRALPLFGLLWSLTSAGMAIGNYAIMLIMRLGVGVLQAGLVPVSLNILARWFPRGSQGFASGSFGASMSVGGALVTWLSAVLVVWCGWRWMFILYAIPGVLWAIWFRRWLRDHPAEHPNVNEAELQLIHPGYRTEDAATAKVYTTLPWKALFSHPAMWFICGQQFCRAAGFNFFGSWFPTYLQETHGASIVQSGFLSMLPLLADISGCLLGGKLSDAVLHRTGNQRLARQGLAIVAMVLCASLFVVASFSASALAAVLVISLGIFCAASGNPCATATIMSMGGRHVAVVSGTMNMCGNFGAALFPVVVPLLLGASGKNWTAVLFLLAGLYVTAAVFWRLLKARDNMWDEPATGEAKA